MRRGFSLFSIFSCMGSQQFREKGNISNDVAPIYEEKTVRIFSEDELAAATGNFSPSCQIGEGGGGTVYKGTLKDGTTVAIKREKKTTSKRAVSKELASEIDMLSRTDHLNLVRLIGYGEINREHIIVTEYVPNGTLREHLDGKRGKILPFSTRLDVVIDISRALTYLHLYADHPIIHRDVKSSNILLTNTLRAKVADFGFSRIGPMDFGTTNIATQVKGTAGYLDPEYLKTQTLSRKSDVYSFGVLLVETFTGRRPIEPKEKNADRFTIRWVLRMQGEDKTAEALDPMLPRTTAVDIAFENLVALALECVAPVRDDRPYMDKVAEALSKIRRDYHEELAFQRTASGSSSESRSYLSSSAAFSHDFSL